MTSPADDHLRTWMLEALTTHLPEYEFDTHGGFFSTSYGNTYILGRHTATLTQSPSQDPDIFSDEQASPKAPRNTVVCIAKDAGRLEKEYKQAHALPNDRHFLRPYRIVHMPPSKPDRTGFSAMLIEIPRSFSVHDMKYLSSNQAATVSFLLEFAIGACEILEILHHRSALMHGELRNDAFHFDFATSTVALLSPGTGHSTFVDRLSSAGWTDLLSDASISYKLQYIAPEQTGRLPVLPDHRTDIYALGIGIWCLSTGTLPFAGREPLEIVQSALSQPLPSLDSVRPDMKMITQVIDRMTKKAMHERYNSISSVKRDLMKIRESVGQDDRTTFIAGKDDVSPVFKLPNRLIGREFEQEVIIYAVDRALAGIALLVNAQNKKRNTTEAALPDTQRYAWQEPESFISVSQSRRRTSNDAVPATSERSGEFQKAIIAVSGHAGHGKSFLLHCLQQDIRSRCQVVFVQVELVKPAPFGTIIKLLSTLMKQTFSTADVDTSSHEAIRHQVRPYWSSLYHHLGLPRWLLDPAGTSSPRATLRERFHSHSTLPEQTAPVSALLLHAIAAVAHVRPICIIIDDADRADNESWMLLENLINTTPIVTLLAHKPDLATAEMVRALTANGQTYCVKAFTQDETILYVAETICSLPHECELLGRLVHARTCGVPAYVRKFLEICNSADCIFYCDGKWNYNLHQIAQYDPITDNEAPIEHVIHRQYQELNADVRALLSWGGFIGRDFSLALIYAINHRRGQADLPAIPPTISDVQSSLQTGLSMFILQLVQQSQQCAFANDRYRVAASMLNSEFDQTTMHYIIADAIITSDLQSRATTIFLAEHIQKAVDVIRSRVEDKTLYLHALQRAAAAHRSNGAFEKSASFCDAALQLLHDKPWSDDLLSTYNQAADVYHLLGRTKSALDLLDQIDSNVTDLNHQWANVITRSRIHASRGDDVSAFRTVHSYVDRLQISDVPADMMACNAWLLRPYKTWRERPCSPEAANILAEIVMSSLCMHESLPYRYAVSLVSNSMGSKDNSAAIIGLVYLSGVALFHLKDFNLCCELRERAVAAMADPSCPKDIYSRGLVLRALLVGHLELAGREQIDALAQALVAQSLTSDRSFLLLNVSVLVVLRVCIADDLAALLQFIEQATSHISDWQFEIPNGVVLVCAQQVVRTLRGLTRINAAETIMCDDYHDSDTFLANLQSPCHDFLRALYQGCRLVMQRFYNYYEQAFEIGMTIMAYVDEFRISLFFNAIFYQVGLAIAATLRDQPYRSDRSILLNHMSRIRARLNLLAAIPQCAAWLLVLEAEIANDNSSIRLLNLAVETIEGRGSPLEEGMCLELFIQCLIRNGATCAVQSLIERCSASFAKAGAAAKAAQILRIDGHNPTILPTLHNSIEIQNEQLTAHGPAWHQSRRRSSTTQLADRMRADSFLEHSPIIRASSTSSQKADQDMTEGSMNGADRIALDNLDVLDLHSIILSSQAMSSELNIDHLLGNLTRIIAESTTAEMCSIVIQAENANGWVVAAQSKNEDSAIKLEQWEDMIAKQVNIYVLRFREEIFIHNTKMSADFAHMGCEEEVSVLCLPLIHSETLLGSIYCQAAPNIFTNRTMTLLKLLVMQISICLSNAILFKENSSMLESQKAATEQARAAEARAVENLRQKKEAMIAKDLFLANISHELRTPLNGVIGLSDMLKDTQLTAHQLDCARSIGVCADTLLNVINDILDFSKLEAGKMQSVKSPILLAQKLRDIVHALRASRPKTDVQTIEDIQIDQDLVVLADPTKLQQVVMNLVTNAFKFTQHGTVVLSALLEDRIGSTMSIKISVQDSGIGIAPDVQRKLFLPFSQADASTSRVYGGTGLGLSICKGIVEGLMSGKIWLESEPGKGTTATFVVPFQVVDASSTTEVPMAATQPIRHKMISKPSKSIKVAIAEDNAINRKVAITLVKKLGHVAEAFEDGRQAVDALHRSNDFDLVLMDLQMPVLDGYGATRELRKSAVPSIRDIIVIALTASTIKGDRERCIEAGMDAYVAKPVRLPMLKETIQSFLQT